VNINILNGFIEIKHCQYECKNNRRNKVLSDSVSLQNLVKLLWSMAVEALPGVQL
jgi:hypothetical protein